MNNILDQSLILKDKKVLIRVDLNVPMKNGAITETSRIEKIIPTIKLLIEKQAKIIIYHTSVDQMEKLSKLCLWKMFQKNYPYY